MTDMEKKIMLRLCAKVIEYVDFETDPEAEQLVNWVILDNQRKQNNNEIRSLIKRGKEICDRRDELYESQQEIKHKLWKLEREI